MWPLGAMRRKDPDVILAMGFDTDYSDYSRYGHVFTPVNSPNITGGSLSVVNPQHLTAVDVGTLELGSSDFTLEARVQIQGTVTQNRNIIAKQTASGGIPILFNISNSTNRLSATIISQTEQSMSIAHTTNNTFVDTTQYHHVAFVRQGQNFYLWQDGALANSILGSSFGSVKDTTSNWYIGAANGTGAGNLNGFIDWLKVTKRALYTAPFTPPTNLTV